MIPDETVETKAEETQISGEIPKKVIRTTTKVTPPNYEEPPQKVYKTKKVIFRTYQIAWYVVGVIEILLAFRFLLKLIGASQFSGFTDFIYGISSPFALPFMGVVGISEYGPYILEWPTLIAMVVYVVLVWLIVQFLQLVKPVNRDEIDQTIN